MTAIRKNGPVDWNDTGTERVGFVKIRKDGTFRVRILGNPFKTQEFWFTDRDGRPFRVVPSEDPACPSHVIAAKQKTTARNVYVLPVIDRTDGKAKVLEVGQQVANAISGLFKQKNWGDPINYDIEIIRRTNGRTSYSVVPLPPSLLSQQDQLERDAFFSAHSQTIQALATPWSKEKVTETLKQKGLIQ